MLCCAVIQNLGCFTSCDQQIKTGLTANVTGNWKYQAEFAGALIQGDFEATAGEEIIIDNVFNENYVTNIKFFDPSGVIFENKCYSFSTIPKITL